MTRDQATAVISILNAGFPRETIEPQTAQLWINYLQDLDHPDAALNVAKGFVFNGDRWPTIREFRQAYASEQERLAPRLGQIEEAPPARGVPEWVAVWRKLRTDGDFRPLPQQPGWDLAPTGRVEQDEYQRILEELKQQPGGLNRWIVDNRIGRPL